MRWMLEVFGRRNDGCRQSSRDKEVNVKKKYKIELTSKIDVAREMCCFLDTELKPGVMMLSKDDEVKLSLEKDKVMLACGHL